jgi:hypothetical protein
VWLWDAVNFDCDGMPLMDFDHYLLLAFIWQPVYVVCEDSPGMCLLTYVTKSTYMQETQETFSGLDPPLLPGEVFFIEVAAIDTAGNRSTDCQP